MRVLFVDDETIIRDGLKSIIPWEEIGFDELFEAADGPQALSIIEEQLPDLVITDIFMPDMSGIDFARLVKERYSATRIIILTGYEKFEYAQEAVRIGVAQYMVKPIFPEELLAVVKESIQEIDKQRGERRWKEDAAKRLAMYNPIIREKFWRDLLTGSYMNQQEMREQQASLNIQFNESGFCIAIKTSQDEIISLYGKNDMPLIKFALRNIAEEMFNRCNVHFVEGEVSLLYGVFLEPVEENLLQSLQRNIEQVLKISVFIGQGNTYRDMKLLAISADEAEEAAHQLFSLGEGGVIRYEQMHDKKNSHVYFPYAREKTLLQHLRFCDRLSSDCLEPFIEVLNEQNASIFIRKLMYVQLLSAVYRLVDEYQLGGQIEPFSENYENIKEAATEHDILQHFLRLFERFVEQKNRAHFGYVERLVEGAKNVIEQNYTNCSFSVGSIADLLNLSPKYLSRIFHKVTGQTCIDYITQARVEAAKKWLKNTSLRSLDIAEKVGYTNAHYFSSVFKKQTGFSPTEYRLDSDSGDA